MKIRPRFPREEKKIIATPNKSSGTILLSAFGSREGTIRNTISTATKAGIDMCRGDDP